MSTVPTLDIPAGVTQGSGDPVVESELPPQAMERLRAERQRLREIAARAFRAQEAERRRLARELQEEFAQQLTDALLRLSLARNATNDAARDEHFEELRERLVGLAESLHLYAKGLHPPALAELGPIAAAQGYARLLTEGSELRIAFEGPDLRGLLTSERELAIYRIVQEALGNVVRHARAGDALVRTHVNDDAVEVRIEDDGLGFRWSAAEEKGGCIGILGMRERALYVGGDLHVESEPGHGTVVVLRLPRDRDDAGTPGLGLRIIGSHS